MTIYITVAVAPNPVKYGVTTYIFGNINEDGIPLTDYQLDVFEVTDDPPVKIFDLTTDSSGDFVAAYTPVEGDIGSHDYQVYVPIYAGIWSDVVTLVITNEADGLPLKVLAGITFAGLGAMFLITRRKR